MIYMIHMLYVLLIHIDMDQFDITISMINYLLYVITIMLIYGIKMIWKMPIILTVLVIGIQTSDITHGKFSQRNQIHCKL
jgi:hypothetical protein